MIKNEITSYLNDYIYKDKSNMAILLNGEWGIGKSYYIKNDFKLKEDKANKIKIVYLSLYGITDLEQLSRSLFFALHFKKDSLKAEKNVGLVSTIAKGLLSVVGFNWELNSHTAKKLFDKKSWENCFIIFDDVERCSIGMKEVFGFINNLVENCNGKILLIANEEKLKIEDGYKDFKDKTIKDVITIDEFPKEAIKDIIKAYEDNKFFTRILKDSKERLLGIIENEIMNNSIFKSRNLRVFKFACQKTYDFLNKCDFEIDEGFCDSVFLGIISKCLFDKSKLDGKRNKTLKYDLCASATLFLENAKFYETIAKRDNELFISSRLMEEQSKEQKQYLENIFNYLYSNESEIKKSLEALIESAESYSFTTPSLIMKIINYLISIKYSICNFDGLVDTAITALINNINALNLTNDNDLFYSSGIALGSEKETEEFRHIEKIIKDQILANKRTKLNANLKFEKMDDFNEFVRKNADSFIQEKQFLSLLNFNVLTNMIEETDSLGIDLFRESLHSVYSFSNLYDYYMTDKQVIEDLHTFLEAYEKQEMDKVKKLQISYLIYNLEDFLKKLQN